jgi:hypothetical protein
MLLVKRPETSLAYKQIYIHTHMLHSTGIVMRNVQWASQHLSVCVSTVGRPAKYLLKLMSAHYPYELHYEKGNGNSFRALQSDLLGKKKYKVSNIHLSLAVAIFSISTLHK